MVDVNGKCVQGNSDEIVRQYIGLEKQMELSQLLDRTAYWLLPQGVDRLLRRLVMRGRQSPDSAIRAKLARNEAWRNHHASDRRCFVLCSGPSIKQQDMALLEGEICISVSNWYVHKDYALIQPRYHCLPYIGGHSQITSEDAVRWLQQMDDKIGQATMFMSYGDKELIERHNLFTSKQVYYLGSGPGLTGIKQVGIDLTGPVLTPQSVSVWALMIAVFMGFKEIYLLGCDHDWISHFGSSAHFYSQQDHTIMSRQGYNQWKGIEDYEAVFRAYSLLWGQYKIIKRHALAKGGRIYNATAGGLLDVFPRMEYESLF